MQDLLLNFPFHPIALQCCLWLDQHAPLMLKLESLTDTDKLHELDEPELNPMENKPFFPNLPEDCWTSLPAIWSGKHTTKDFQKNPILKLLWKAAPRKSHSSDIASLVQKLIETNETTRNTILSIHRASMLGNYRNSKGVLFLFVDMAST